MPLRRSLSRVVSLGLLTVFASCQGDGTGPATLRHGGLELAVRFEDPAAASIVAFEQVRIRLTRTDESTALDTVLAFPATATSLTLNLLVPLGGFRKRSTSAST